MVESLISLYSISPVQKRQLNVGFGRIRLSDMFDYILRGNEIL